MLPRSLRQSTRHVVSSSFRGGCQVCRCNCGRTIPRNEFNTILTRGYASRLQRPPPDTRAGAGLGKKQMKHDSLSQDDAARLYRAIMRRKLEGTIQGQPDQLLAFVEMFAHLAAIRAPNSGPGVDTSTFKKMIQDTEISSKDARWCGRWLVSNTDPELRQLGRKMMYTLSHAGDGWATLIIMEGTLAETTNRAGLLNSSELVLVRRQLSNIAADNLPDAMEEPEQLFMAKVCEGRVAASLGNPDNAISMWKSAMEDAITYANQRGDKAGDIPAMWANSSPWIDLFNLSFARGNTETARLAVEIGCELDDPVSHYHAALLERRVKKGARFIPTSTWLYHITKAAGSGHVKAIHALGFYYSTVQWKYFEDEPPDHMKPTPFDSYPASEHREKLSGQSFGAAFGLQPTSATDPRENLFLTSLFPSEPYERWKMAMGWLDTAMGLMYAPSFLLAAKLFMQDTLSRGTVAPEEALSLSDQRYKHASNYEAGKGVQSSRKTHHDLKQAKSIPNPSYNLSRAKDLIREVFYVVQAQAYRHNQLSQYDKARPHKSLMARSSSDLNMMLSETMSKTNVSPNIKKWFQSPELMQTYTDGKQGTIIDDFTNVDVGMEARRICDEMAWDLYDEDGGLVYKHR